MTKVKLQQYGGKKRYALNQLQTRIFEREIQRVKKGSRPKRSGIFPGVAPDCTITVFKGKRKTEYELFGRTVLQEKKSGNLWQFYLGLLLLEYLSK